MTTVNTKSSTVQRDRNAELTAVILLIGLVCIVGIIIGAAALGESLGVPMLVNA